MHARLTGIAAVLLVALGTTGVAAERDAEREAQDRADIQKAMWQYVRALDTRNADAYAAVFAPDGQFGTGANAIKGREALKKLINDLRQRAAATESKSGVKAPPVRLNGQWLIKMRDVAPGE